MKKNVETKPRKLPGQARSRETVEYILEATARVLVDGGYAGASTNRVAEVAGVSVGSLYQYFPNKESLVATLMDRHVKEMMGVFGGRLEQVEDAPLEVGVRALVEAAVRAHAVNPKLHRVFLEQAPRVGNLEKIRRIESRIEAGVRRYLAKRAGRFAPEDLELTTFVVVRAVESVTHDAVLDRPEYLEGDRLTDELTDMVLGYLSPATDCDDRPRPHEP